MRIVIVHNRYREPGGEDAVVRTETELLRGDHEVVLHEVENPVSTLAASAALALSAWNPRSEQRIRDLVEGSHFDAAHVHNTWFQLSPAVLRPLARAGIPVVMTVHNYRRLCIGGSFHRDGHRCVDCLHTLPWRGIAHRCYRGSAVQSAVLAMGESTHRILNTWEKYTDLFVAPSEFTRNLLTEGGLPADRVVVKPHHVADPGRRPAPPSESRKVVYVGRLSADKGVRMLVEAWREAAMGMELVLAGDGALRSELEDLRDPSVRLTGWLPSAQLAQLVSGARAVVLPTTMFETFGLSAVEALAAGTPVLTTAGGAIAEAVGDCGPAGPAPDAGRAEWADALRALSDDTAVDRWGSLGRRRYCEVYGPQLGLTRLLGIYELAADIGSRRRDH
jgi:glycosyltransferase involved in cell wall biosynthesis